MEITKKFLKRLLVCLLIVCNIISIGFTINANATGLDNLENATKEEIIKYMDKNGLSLKAGIDINNITREELLDGVRVLSKMPNNIELQDEKEVESRKYPDYVQTNIKKFGDYRFKLSNGYTDNITIEIKYDRYINSSGVRSFTKMRYISAYHEGWGKGDFNLMDSWVKSYNSNKSKVTVGIIGEYTFGIIAKDLNISYTFNA